MTVDIIFFCVYHCVPREEILTILFAKKSLKGFLPFDLFNWNLVGLQKKRLPKQTRG